MLYLSLGWVVSDTRKKGSRHSLVNLLLRNSKGTVPIKKKPEAGISGIG